ncbi:unnamed protein product [Clavelina lepadiformis]|uniref:Uncharacterized protein n=1 Tax=Clavelina lepadiformis TaxID=159417 RepID=A0ABP0GZH5_CLALP
MFVVSRFAVKVIRTWLLPIIYRDTLKTTRTYHRTMTSCALSDHPDPQPENRSSVPAEDLLFEEVAAVQKEASTDSSQEQEFDINPSIQLSGRSNVSCSSRPTNVTPECVRSYPLAHRSITRDSGAASGSFISVLWFPRLRANGLI